MMEKPRQDSLWSTAFVSLLVLSMFTATSFYMMNPIISKYVTLLGAALGLAGVVAGLFSLTALTARPIGAVIVDRMNRKYVLAGATALMAVGAFGYSLSGSVVGLIVFRIVHGTAFAISGTASAALIASMVPRSRLGEGIGYYGMGYIFATAIGPNVGISLAEQYGYRANFVASGIALLVAAALMLRIPYAWTPPAQAGPKRIALGDLISFKVLPLALIGGIFSFTNGIVSSFLVLIGEERQIANIGLYFTVMAICMFIIRPFTGKLSDRKGLAIIVYPAFFLVALESALLINASVLWVVLVAAAAKAFGSGAAKPAIQTACLKKLDASKSGVAAATYFIGADIGQGVGPMVGGKLAESHGYGSMFYLCLALLLVGVIAFFISNVFEKRESSSIAMDQVPELP